MTVTVYGVTYRVTVTVYGVTYQAYFIYELRFLQYILTKLQNIYTPREGFKGQLTVNDVLFDSVETHQAVCFYTAW